MPLYPQDSKKVKLEVVRSRPAVPPLETLLTAALGYHKRGWSCFPLVGKDPAVKAWKPYEKRLPTEAELQTWFGNGTQATGIGVICGPALVIRDFDNTESFHRWLAAHPKGETLPRVRTARGWQVYFRPATPVRFEDFGKGIGELRAGKPLSGGHYCVAPPSIHPETGKPYVWEVLPPDGELPVVDVEEMGLNRSWAAVDDLLTGANGVLTAAEVEVHQGSLIDDAPAKPALPCPSPLRHVKAVGACKEHVMACDGCVTIPPSPTATPGCNGCVTLPLKEEVVRAMAEKRVAKQMHATDHNLFALSRDILTAIGRKPTAKEGNPFFQAWHRIAAERGVLNPLRTKERYHIEFNRCLKNAKVPTGSEPFSLAVKRAKTALNDAAKHPAWLVELEHKSLQLLALVCRELQLLAGDAPFPLSARKAAEAIGEAGAWRRLDFLCDWGLLKVERRINFKDGKLLANEYRWLGEVAS